MSSPGLFVDVDDARFHLMINLRYSFEIRSHSTMSSGMAIRR